MLQSDSNNTKTNAVAQNNRNDILDNLFAKDDK